MLQNSIIEQLYQDMQQSPWDIKAEALLLLAVDRGLEQDEYMVGCDALFSREFSKDISFSEVKEDSQKKPLLQLHLSRTGLYDQLPEGLFFQARKQTTTGDMCADYKHNKKREEEIRKFFLPFENDFFKQRLAIEEEEDRLLEGLRSGLLNDYFTRFWDLPAALPKALAAPFVLLIPYAYQIAGNLDLTTHSLEQLLKEQVVIHKKNIRQMAAHGMHTPCMGEGVLGLDLVCGNEFFEDNFALEIEIGPLKNSQVTEYLPGGSKKLLIETFARFFVPAGTETIVSINVEQERQHMCIKKDAGPLLGYSSTLGA